MTDSRRRPRNRRNNFMYWWPVTSRVTGIVIAAGHVTYQSLTRQPFDASVLGFCGALIVAPNVLGGGRA